MGSFSTSDVEKAKQLREEAEENPEAVSISELRELLDSSKLLARVNAAGALGIVAEKYPDDVRPAVDTLQPLLADDNKRVRAVAVGALAAVAVEYPGDVRPAVDALQPLLADDDKFARQSAALALAAVAEEYPGDVRPAVDALQPLLADDDKFARRYAALALAAVAEEYPGDVRPAVDALQPLLADDYKYARRYAAWALAWVAAEYPGDVRPAVDALQSLLADDYKYARRYAAWALAEVAEEYPGDVRPAVDALQPLLTDDYKYARRYAAWALGKVAAEYPGAVQQTVEKLADLLDDAKAGEAAEEALTAVADGGDTDRVRQAVEDTAPDRLDDILGEIDAESGQQSPVDFGAMGSPPPVKMSAAPDEIPAGPVLDLEFDALDIDEMIGQGGNAFVYRATTVINEDTFTLALKEPQTPADDRTFEDFDALDQILSEAEKWQKLDDHDHIVDVVDYGEEPLPWIAMEYMDGSHLGEYAGEMELDQALWTALALVQGVHHAHKRGIAHLDLKPKNILFRTVEDAWDVPKVADWGLSKHLLDYSESAAGLSTHYAAPEQFDSDAYGTPDHVTDIYQLGVLLYELFTGRRPFEGGKLEVIEQIRTEQPTPPSDVADVPAGFDEVILTAMATDKTGRYEEIVYLRDALRRLQGTVQSQT